jgi:hypothetical protein
MRIPAYAISVLIAATLFSARGASQIAKQSRAPEERNVIATSRYLSKGGIGMISEELYVVVKSARNDRNELIVEPPGHLGKDQSAPVPQTRWKGKNATEAEVAIFFEGRVWSPQDLPDRFDLSKAIVVSFESDKVRFFNFQAMSGGYYERIRE